MLLQLKNISAYYHEAHAISNINIEVEEGQIVTIVGPNGAGKSTTLRTISGLKRPYSGEIWFEDTRIDNYRPEKINSMGLAQVLENRRVFPLMTVMENLEMGAFLCHKSGNLNNEYENVFNHFPVLKDRKKQLAGTLSGGEQQMLAMGRALMSNPKLLLMDEPSLGLSPILCFEIAKIVKNIHKESRTIVLVEQNARMALSIAEKGYVLETGNIVLEGSSKDLRENENVKKAYLGV